MKTSKISRVVRILAILQSDKNYSPDDLAGIFNISRRTLFRDLKELQKIGIPYYFDAKTNKYAIDREFFLTPVDLNVKEALSLLLLTYNSINQLQVPQKSSALSAAIKIESMLSEKLKQYCKSNLKHISVKSCPQAPTKFFDELFLNLQQAITEKRKADIKYHSLFEGKILNLCIHPYHLLFCQRAWYIIAYSEFHKSIRTFKLNRIKNLSVLKTLFFIDKPFHINDYLGKAWLMMPEGKLYNVKLKFSPKVAHNVSEVLWHPTQSITQNSDGSVIMEFRVDGLTEISWWLLGYGDQVQVLSPQALRQRVVDTAKNIIKINKTAFD